MSEARQLIRAFHENNRSDRKSVVCFTPSLVGMFGSTGIFDSFLSEIDAVIEKAQLPSSIKKRATNLIDTFIPQVAEYNGIKQPLSLNVTAADLQGISSETLQERRAGVAIILSALIQILKEAGEVPECSE